MEVLTTVGATVGATTVASVATTAATNSVTRIMNFKDNHESLKIKIGELRALRDDVKRRIKVAEDNLLMCTAVVSQWLDRVEEVNEDVILILEDVSRVIGQNCCYPNSWWACYKLGKKVSKMLMTVEELCSKGHFDSVADSSGPDPVQVLPESETVGMDKLFGEVWNFLGKDEVKVMGIYGMGGVGKTTLLKKLNNAFINEAGQFDVVIWVVVSKEFSIRNVQKEIGKRLGLKWKEERDQSENAERIFNAMRKKKFVVMLDDIWKLIDLEMIGIPSPHDTLNKSKLLFTTRLEDVCGGMLCDKRVKVPVLDWNQSWTLFQNNVGQEALRSHPELEELAEEVDKECCGLPLALITIGRAMTSKKTPPEWKHAVKTLRKYASEFSGMEQNVLTTLKFSYDNLENDTVKRCFIYFSLYPEDSVVQKQRIIHSWIGEGFLDDCEDMDDAIDKGHDIIGRLKAACLLETGHNISQVKMHDIVRDLALWIARECGKKRGKYLVQAGVGLTRAPQIENWEEAERISLMRNDIEELLVTPKCPYLLTILLQENFQLLRISTDLFQYMPRLRVLSLSSAKITDIPKSIGSLLQLQFLDLSRMTEIKTLPEELGNLVELRYLSLNRTPSLAAIPPGMISRFSRLKILDLYESGHKVKGHISHPSLFELESLEHLREFGVNVQEFPVLSSMLLSLKLCSCLTKLYILGCKGLTKLSLASSSSIHRDLRKLEELKIEECLEMEELVIDSATDDHNMGLLVSLKRLHLKRLPELSILWTERCEPIHFKNFSSVSIESCNTLRDLSWLVYVPFLESLMVSGCAQLEEIMLVEPTGILVDDPTIFSRIRRLSLQDLPKLKSISRKLPFPSLESIRVVKCPLLKNLPFAHNNTKKLLLKIKGKKEWWNSLQWADQTVQSSFQPFFEDLVRGVSHLEVTSHGQKP